jgi:hypothetical protein
MPLIAAPIDLALFLHLTDCRADHAAHVAHIRRRLKMLRCADAGTCTEGNCIRCMSAVIAFQDTVTFLPV